MRFKLITILFLSLVMILVITGCAEKEIAPMKKNGNNHKPANSELDSNAKKNGLPGTKIPLSEVDVETMTEEEIINRTAAYRVLAGENDWITICPGTSETNVFTIKNVGENPDTYILIAKSKMGWGDFNSLPSELSLNPNEEMYFEIPIHVPATAAPGENDKFEIIVTSQAEPNLRDATEIVVEVCEKSKN